MIKVIAAVTLISCFGMCGLIFAKQYSDRPIHLRSLQFCLQMLATDISYSAYPLPYALASISKRADRNIASLFTWASEMILSDDGYTAEEAWEYGLDSLMVTSALKPVDREILTNLGKSLGLSDREEQLKHINLAINQLDQELERAQIERDKNERLYKYLGFCAGLMIVIFII